MSMEEYVTLALQNCMNTMIDCLYYYHMTDGKPELADFVKKNDKKSILEYCISCEQELLAKYELLYILFTKQTVNSNPRIPFVTQDSLFVNENPVL